MWRSCRLLSILAVSCLSAVAVGQSQVRSGPGSVNFPTVGSSLPVVQVFDDEGNSFSTKSLRGHHSVLVFGCLT
jgi:cytochrome oxidase Cu insertion factor (SCO1/SenC/PrrC family)